MRPYQADASYKEGGHENVESEHTCCPVLSCSYSTDKDSASYFAMIDADGQVVDFLRLKHLLWRRNSRKEHESKAKVDLYYPEHIAETNSKMFSLWYRKKLILY